MNKLLLLLTIFALPIYAMEQISKKDGAVYLLAKSRDVDLKTQTMAYYFIPHINKAETLVELEKICAQFMPLYLDCLSINKQKILEEIHKAFKERENEIIQTIALQIRAYGLFHVDLSRGINYKNYANESPFSQCVDFTCRDKKLLPLVKILIDNGGDVNTHTGYMNDTLLHDAVSWGHFEIAQLFLKSGADINSVNNNLDAPLHVVGHQITDDQLFDQLVDLLIEYEPNVHALNKDGEIPLHRAAHRGNTNIISRLLALGSNVNARDKNLDTPLHNAMYSLSTDRDTLLLQAGADINAQNKQGYTPLHISARHGSPHAALLLQHGADKTIEDKEGNTAADLAQKSGYIQNAQLIESIH